MVIPGSPHDEHNAIYSFTTVRKWRSGCIQMAKALQLTWSLVYPSWKCSCGQWRIAITNDIVCMFTNHHCGMTIQSQTFAYRFSVLIPNHHHHYQSYWEWSSLQGNKPLSGLYHLFAPCQHFIDIVSCNGLHHCLASKRHLSKSIGVGLLI